MKAKFVWRFTLVNKLTLERVEEVIAFGDNLKIAEKHLFSEFPSTLFEVTDITLVSNSSFVMVGMSNYKNLLS